MCLFYLNSTGILLPVAIQLFAKPGPENPVGANCNSEYFQQIKSLIWNFNQVIIIKKLRFSS